MDQRKRFFNLLEHLSNQAKAGLDKCREYLDEVDYEELDESTKTFIVEHMDHYMNIIQFVNDFCDHHLRASTKDCPDNCEHEVYDDWLTE